MTLPSAPFQGVSGEQLRVPYFEDVGVVVFPPAAWCSPWGTSGAPLMARSSHQLMARLAAYFPIVWLNPPHERDGVWRAARARLAGTDAPAPDTVPAGMHVAACPPWLPELHRPAWLRAALRRRRLAAALRGFGPRPPARLALSLWRPEYAWAAGERPDALTLYHICDEYTFADHPSDDWQEERALIRAAGRVFVHSPGLMERKGHLNPATRLTPNGVDFDAFSRDWPEPGALAAIPRPRLGYTGALKKHLDFELLHEVATANPGWSLVLVGAAEPHPEIEAPLARLRALPNVHLLPPVASGAVPALVAHFDACMLPYRRMPYTDQIYPLKLHEYLAAGKPVLATSIRTVREFAPVVTVADTAAAWSAALRAPGTDVAAVRHRQDVARQYDWRHPTLTIAREIVGALAPERLEEFERHAASLGPRAAHGVA